MDQEAFRKLLSTPNQNGSQRTPTASRGPLLPTKAKDDQKKSTDASKAAFKPRRVKKQTDLGYRDRAAERRTGVAGDFAEVEAVLETFEKQHANEDKEIVEERRKYLGGDVEHTVLVKGLDFALLEQTKARLAASTSARDDEELEEALRGAGSLSLPPFEQSAGSKKRTREDIVQGLKNKREKRGEGPAAPTPSEDKGLEEARREGKFKPIGFKPIGSSTSKSKEGKKVKKKKKNVAGDVSGGGAQLAASEATLPRSKGRGDPSTSRSAQESEKKTSAPEPQTQPEPEPINEDFDIFADAGEYEGINFDGDESDVQSEKRNNKLSEAPPAASNESTPKQTDEQPSEPQLGPKRKWIDDDEPPSPPPDRSLLFLSDPKGKRKATPSPPTNVATPISDDEAQPETEPEEPITRLAPLASSAIPSIRDILEADSALEAEKKRKARKEKKKRGAGGGGGSEGEGKKASKEAKINRDYQKLKSYTEKKGGEL